MECFARLAENNRRVCGITGKTVDENTYQMHCRQDSFVRKYCPVNFEADYCSMKFFKVNGGVGYTIYDEERHRVQIQRELERGIRCSGASFSVEFEPLQIGFKHIPFYIFGKSPHFFEYFTGLPVMIHSTRNTLLVGTEYSKGSSGSVYPLVCLGVTDKDPLSPSEKSLSAIEFEREVNSVSPAIRNKIVSAVTESYRKACHEADLYELGEKKIRAQLQQEADAEKNAAERLFNKRF